MCSIVNNIWILSVLNSYDTNIVSASSHPVPKFLSVYTNWLAQALGESILCSAIFTWKHTLLFNLSNYCIIELWNYSSVALQFVSSNFLKLSDPVDSKAYIY